MVDDDSESRTERRTPPRPYASPDDFDTGIRRMLGAQRWYAGPREPVPPVRTESTEYARRSGAVRHVLAQVDTPDGPQMYQLLLSAHLSADADRWPAEAPSGWHDTLSDPRAAAELLAIITGGQFEAATARPIGVEQSNTSVIYDDRWLLKLFRRVEVGPNPDCEVPADLARVGFDRVAAPLWVWEEHGRTLAVLTPFLAGGREGWASAVADATAWDGTGDAPFAAEARALGEGTARLHLAMEDAYGREPGDSEGWSEATAAMVASVDADPGPVVTRMRRADPGPQIRVHGDLHLGQVLRTEDGWWFLDFEGEPNRPPAERLAASSPFKDVAGMLRSFDYAAATADRAGAPPEITRRWERQCRAAYLQGYLATPGIGAVLPPEADRATVLANFELEKAAYEVGYERAYRPDWEPIPAAALTLLTTHHQGEESTDMTTPNTPDAGQPPAAATPAATPAPSSAPADGDEVRQTAAPAPKPSTPGAAPTKPAAPPEPARPDAAGAKPAGTPAASEAKPSAPAEKPASPAASKPAAKPAVSTPPSHGAEPLSGDSPGVVPMTPALRAAAKALAEGTHTSPHSVLGYHDGSVGVWRPGASAVAILVDGDEPVALTSVDKTGLWSGRVPAAEDGYRVQVTWPSGATATIDDPYRFWPTLGEVDLHLFGEGNHRHLWEVLGAHVRDHQGVLGVSFTVWAPAARAVRVVGDWNLWDGRIHPMRSMGSSGVWELFIPEAKAGDRYKFEILTQHGHLKTQADPMARRTELMPGTASVVEGPSQHVWGDDQWLADRAGQDLLHGPVSIYELHLGSWRWMVEADGFARHMTYRELADALPVYLTDMGFTHVEFLPVAEHPYGPSWGYQVTGYYAPTARFGTPDDFRHLVDALHRAGIGVLVDWVPAHFPKDSWALARFDGSALYEHEDPRKGEHPDWGTLVFNVGRNEVRNFLTANALYWMKELHIDGLRVDAVASMLYLDYSRDEGQWVPNQYGGRENLDSVEFFKQLNTEVYGEVPGAVSIAEESTAWPGVSSPVYNGGLGFGFKWNMGWMHDTLEYFSKEPIYRSYDHDKLTFGLIYAFSENFILPLSHDEVVHGKGSLLNKMPGDEWQKFANLRALYGWMWAHPGKQMLFMGGEIGPYEEWSESRSLPWHLLQYDCHRGVQSLVRDLNHCYRDHPALWTQDNTYEGFKWIDASDKNSSVLAFMRYGPDGQELACIANLTPVPRTSYRIGLSRPGQWREVLNTDAAVYDGSGMGNGGGVWAEEYPYHGQPASAPLTLPPLSVLWLVPD